MSISLTCNDGRKFVLSQKNENGVKKFVLSKDAFCNERGSAVLTSDLWKASVSDDGYFIVPMDTHLVGDVKIDFKERQNHQFNYFIEECCPLVPFFVICKNGKSRLYKINHTYGWKIRAEYKDGQYMFSLLYNLDDEIIDRDIEIVEFEADGTDWCVLANIFRDYAISIGEIVPNASKLDRAVFSYAIEAPIIRIRMGWKPAPSPVESQTLENEPPMFVACTFERVREFALALKESGLQKAEIQLVGWNIGGHDGRWPQAFPIDERVGGEDELKKTIEFVSSLGYEINCHYNSTDSYEIADIYRPDLVAKDRNGNHILGGCWGGGRAHVICPDRQIEACGGVIEDISRLGFKGLNYSDVLSVVYPTVCFDKQHPCSTAQGIARNEETMRLHKKFFGGFSSEGTYYHSLKELDFGLYSTFCDAYPGIDGCRNSNLIDEYVSFSYMILHGCVLYNTNTTTVNYPIKEKKARLELFANGGKPTFYCYSKFKADGKNWMGNIDLRLDDKQEIMESVTAIKTAMDEYLPIADLQTKFIVSVKKHTCGVSEVIYEGGTKLIFNYTQTPVTVSGVTVPAEDFVVVR